MGMNNARDFREAVENYKFAANVYSNNHDDYFGQKYMAMAVEDLIKFSAQEGKKVTFHDICNSPIPQLLDIPFGAPDEVVHLKMISFKF